MQCIAYLVAPSWRASERATYYLAIDWRLVALCVHVNAQLTQLVSSQLDCVQLNRVK